MYDLFYLPLIFILLREINFNYDEISEIFKFFLLILLITYMIQLIDINFYFDIFLNNIAHNEIGSVWEKRHIIQELTTLLQNL